MEIIDKKNVLSVLDFRQMKYLKVDQRDGEYIVSLVDSTGYEILKGYGNSVEEAINDLHHNLI